jgi:hypothetical protein
MKELVQNLHTSFLLLQALDLVDYFSRVTIEGEQDL